MFLEDDLWAMTPALTFQGNLLGESLRIVA